ncbi:MAG: hypothetical protein ACLVBP_16245 [Ruminococcus sp.]
MMHLIGSLENGGFEPKKKVTAGSGVEAVTGAHKINVLVACGQTCKTVPKISSIYYFAPGAHTKAMDICIRTDLSPMYLYFRMAVMATSTAFMWMLILQKLAHDKG